MYFQSLWKTPKRLRLRKMFGRVGLLRIDLEIGVHADGATLGDLPKNRNDCSEGKG